MTAPVKAILATLDADVVGLRCRPLIGRRIPLVERLRGQLSGSGWRGRPAVIPWNRVGFTPRNRGRFLVRSFGGPVGPPPPSTVLVLSTPNGWSSARWDERAHCSEGSAAWRQTRSGSHGRVTFYGNRRFRVPQILKNALRRAARHCLRRSQPAVIEP